MKSDRKQQSRINALLDPSEIPTMVASLFHHTPPVESSNLPSPELSGLLSTMIQFSVPALPLPENHLFDPPLHGPSDPFVAAGKSITPSARALSDMGIQKAKSVQDMFPGASEYIQSKAQIILNKGGRLMDGEKILHGGDASFPGFMETKSILAPHAFDEYTRDSPAQFAARASYSSMILPVIDKLPYVAFWYAVVEFFFLRPNLDVYKEDVEDDPVGVASETISDVGVRLGFFFILAMLTLVFT
jgi:hypothetical protein